MFWRITPAAILAVGLLLPSTSPAQSAPDEFIEYQIRANDDPTKVARMFHVTPEELLALNHITDPHRLTVGTMLKIPDPRAAAVKQISKDKEALEVQLATAHKSTATLQGQLDDLQSQLAELRETNDALQSEQALYHAWRMAVFVAGGTAVVLALGLLLAWGKARDAERQVTLLEKETEVLHAAVDKYRQLGAQFELKYQSVFHQVGLPSPAQARAQSLRAAYDDDRARLDAIVAEAERDIKGALAALAPKHEPRQAEAPMALATARKSG